MWRVALVISVIAGVSLTGQGYVAAVASTHPLGYQVVETLAAAAEENPNAVFQHQMAACCGESLAAVGRSSYDGDTSSADMRIRLSEPPPYDQPQRVIVADRFAYLPTGGAGWRKVAVSERGHPLAFTAGTIRSATGLEHVIALLRASTVVRRGPELSYRGVADLTKLTKDPAVSQLYGELALAPGRKLVSYTLWLGPDFLPRQLRVVWTLHRGDEIMRKIFLTRYRHWYAGRSITAPRG